MNILVTGGAGFIGSHVVDAYIEDGHRVVVVDNLSSGKKKHINKKAVFYEVDILDNSIDSIIYEERIDCINHHAAQIDVRRSVKDPRFDCKINIIGSLNLLQASVKRHIKHFIFASTGGAIYGEQDYFPADEKHPQNPLSPYGISKLSVEKYLYFYLMVHNLHYTVLRYANVYGPRQDPHGEAGVVAIFSNSLLSGGIPTINGDGRQTRDYTFVYDVASANRFALNNKEAGSFNVGTGVETSVVDLYNILCAAAGSKEEPRFGPAKKGEQKRSVLSYDKINASFGWEPKYALNDGLKTTVEYFKNEK